MISWASLSYNPKDKFWQKNTPRYFKVGCQFYFTTFDFSYFMVMASLLSDIIIKNACIVLELDISHNRMLFIISHLMIKTWWKWMLHPIFPLMIIQSSHQQCFSVMVHAEYPVQNSQRYKISICLYIVLKILCETTCKYSRFSCFRSVPLNKILNHDLKNDWIFFCGTSVAY